jgi:hypothetical protein
MLFFRLVGQDDQVGLCLTLTGFFLQHSIDRDRCVGQDASDVGSYTGLVGDTHAKVVAGGDF